MLCTTKRITMSICILTTLLTLLTTHLHALTYPANPSQVKAPDFPITTYYMAPQNLWNNRQLYRQGFRDLNSPINRFIRLADAAVADTTCYSVTSKPSSLYAPSGDPKDFYSLGRYFWPSSTNPSGQYVQFDGYVNPEINLYSDEVYLKTVFNDIFNGAMAYFFTYKESYAQMAASRMNCFFVDPVTGLNPNMNYANWIKNAPFFQVNGGTFNLSLVGTAGVLTTANIYLLLDAFSILRNSPSLSRSTIDGMVSWFKQYLNWLQTSPRALKQASAANNLGTWYDVQVIALNLFLDNSAQATYILQTQTLSRVAGSIQPNGQQPFELARPLSWFYSNFDLQAFFVTAHLGVNVGVDVVAYETPDGRGVAQGLNYLIPFAKNGGQGWPVPNTGTFANGVTAQLCKEAFVFLRDRSYLQAAMVMQNNTPRQHNPSRLWVPYDAYDARTSGGKRDVARPWGSLTLVLIVACSLFLACAD